jgi:uncharacterized protein YbaR (Trm112 family)
MFIELLDQLRCPRPHEESWLVLASSRTEGRDVLEGVLGCPVCQAEYPIVGGVARFTNAIATSTGAADEQEALRLAATLDLTGSEGYAILMGKWGAQAALLHALTDVQLMLVNAPTELAMGWGLSGIVIEQDWVRLPLARGSARAIALDATATLAQVGGAVEILSAGGRLLATVGLPLPDGVTELARDERDWIGERARARTSSGIVSLTRRK